VSFLSGTAYMAMPLPEGAWIIEKVIPQGGIGVLYGTAKAGKSYLALQLAEAISNPKRSAFLDLPIARHGTTAFLQLDTPRSLWHERMNDMKTLNPDLDFSHVFIADRAMPEIPSPFNILADGPWLKAQLEIIKPILVVIDTLRDAHPADENDASAMRNVLIAMLNAVPANCAILILAHRRKEFQFDDDDLLNSLRGSTAIVGKMDIIFGLKRISKSTRGVFRYTGRATEEVEVKLEFSKDREVWELDSDEQKVNNTLKGIMNDLPDASMREWGREMVVRCDRWKDAKDPSDSAFQWIKRRMKKRTKPKLVKAPEGSELPSTPPGDPI
jgi:hypothetical protein